MRRLKHVANRSRVIWVRCFDPVASWIVAAEGPRAKLRAGCSSKSRRASPEPADSTRMAELHADDGETLTHHLVLPRDANHHGTLYAGVLLSLALEAGYATAFRAAGLTPTSS